MNLSISQLLIVGGFILVLGELLVGIEAGFDLVLIGSILVLGGLTGVVTQNTLVALAISIVLSIVYIVFGRNAVKKKITVITHKTNIDKLIGKHGVVIRSITPDTPGLVRLDDEDWRATSSQVLYEKQKIIVQSLSGVTLNVKKVVK